jgi:hypothetical protein
LMKHHGARSRSMRLRVTEECKRRSWSEKGGTRHCFIL